MHGTKKSNIYELGQNRGLISEHAKDMAEVEFEMQALVKSQFVIQNIRV